MKYTESPDRCGICGLNNMDGDDFAWIDIPRENKAISACVWCACQLASLIMDKAPAPEINKIFMECIAKLIVDANSVSTTE